MSSAARAMATAWIIDMECEGNLDRYLRAYQDGGGIWTIAGGSTVMPIGRPVHAGDQVTHAQAVDLLDRQIDEWGASITRAITVPLSDAWQAMLTSFVHQEGPGALPGSVLADMVNAGLLERAGRQLNGWVIARVNGVRQPVLGIMRRMEAQRLVAAGGALEPTRARVWQLGDAVLRPLYTAACADALAYRHGVATWTSLPASVPTHPSNATAARLLPPMARSIPQGASFDDLNAASLAGTLQIGE